MSEKTLTPRELMRCFINTDKLHRSLVETKMADFKLHRSQHMMLFCISCCENPPTQKELAQKLGISAATVTVTAKKLEAQGYIVKAENTKDNRCNTISITSEGRRILEKAKEIFDSIDKAMFDGLSQEELLQFVDCMTKLQNNLKACGASLQSHYH